MNKDIATRCLPSGGGAMGSVWRVEVINDGLRHGGFVVHPMTWHATAARPGSGYDSRDFSATLLAFPSFFLQEALRDMQHFKAPSDKLECIINSCRIISPMLSAMSKPG